MKIGPSNTDGIRVDAGTTAGADRSSSVRPGEGAGPAPLPTSVDRVSLSGKTMPPAETGGLVSYNDKKVEEIRQAIVEGRFPVDAKRVAEQLLADARDFLGMKTAS
ncbi:MAG: flagellar biosynthesis anti-sigma factor FlgM [Burkholderiales bacterium]|nr:flagellar biosynthesis anti-sigma factor FlgM [Burkholderiales bacterium]